jgi:hypothetical protein
MYFTTALSYVFLDHAKSGYARNTEFDVKKFNDIGILLWSQVKVVHDEHKIISVVAGYFLFSTSETSVPCRNEPVFTIYLTVLSLTLIAMVSHSIQNPSIARRKNRKPKTVKKRNTKDF